MMFGNFLKSTFRNLLRNKIYTIINTAGLSLGIVCALVIFLIIKFEYSFDHHHEETENIYRIVTRIDRFGEMNYDPGVPYPLPQAVRIDFPEIELLTIVDSNHPSPVIAVEHDGSVSRYKEPSREVAFVDPDYFKMFSYPWLAGDPEEVLSAPSSVVISEGLAQKYFGDDDPLGKNLRYNNSVDLHIAGVIAEVPQNTDLPFNMLIAYDYKLQGNDNWGRSTAVQCYLRLPKNVPPNQINRRFHEFLAKHRSQEVADQVTLSLQPIREVHFDTRFENFRWRTVAEESLFALGLIGVFLIITACINFVNLNTALAVRRSKEVGVRKVLGGTRKQLVAHFLGETATITLLAILISIPLIELLVINLPSFLGYSLTFDLLSEPTITLFLGTLFVSVTLIAGFYPALYLSGFSPIEAIRNKISAAYGEGLPLRKGLAVLQFAISQVLIVSAIVISSQMKYLGNVDLGFNKEAVVEVSLPSRDPAKLSRLKNELLQYASIKGVSFSNTGTASSNTWGGPYSFKDSDQLKEGEAQLKFVDQDFIRTYELNVLAGEGLAGTDTLERFVVNETFVEKVGHQTNYSEVIGKFVKIWGREAPISGVVNDFHTSSLHTEVPPVIMLMQNRFGQAGIRIEMTDVASSIAAVETAWSSVYPEYVFDYSFLDETIAKFYEEEQKTARLINVFTIIAILIGCMGLFGLVSYMATQRTKEIGIRKVLGASFSNILSLFAREFTALILLAFVIAAPLAYFFMQAWLTDFAYRIDLGTPIFFMALLASFLIAFGTVGYRTAQAATANPVSSLRSE